MEVVDLCGCWRLSRKGKRENIPATVPGCVHTDLLRAGMIEDPFFRDNERKLQWIGREDWVYRRKFKLDKSFLSHKRILLRCDGLDTLASIKLNCKKVGEANNMFRAWEFDVKDLLKGTNEIEILFRSPVRYAERMQRVRYLHAWKGPLEIQGGNWLRKEQCNFGWDWGPCLVTSGIWRPIKLLGFSTARISDLHIRQKHMKSSVELALVLSVEKVDRTPLLVKAELSLRGEKIAECTAPVRRLKGTVHFEIKNPQLWYPNGLGEQPLYELSTRLYRGDGELLDEWTKRIGLRTLRLRRRKDRSGESFGFVVNGIPFFAKGANWIPADTFPTRQGRERYEHLLRSARDANMNMLRVWGGGIYEDETFYELCDELGICVWQDFAFACATYPTFETSFLENVRAEAEEQVRRLRHHPCIALWCGNNELEQGLVGEQWTDRQMSWSDYSKLFDRLLPEIVRKLDPERDYWPSSAHSPYGDRSEANEPRWGDAHLWSVWFGRQPFEWYRTTTHRFVSEFGFQSFPEPLTIYSFTSPEDRNVTSYVMELHQRSGIGNQTIITYMLDWFRLPSSFEMTLWLSQILQSLAIKYAVEHWRRNMPHTMGALYWQLNDCWQVASWSSIDYFGRWKALHYAARRFFSPILLSAVEKPDEGRVEIYLTSDELKPRRVRVEWRLITLLGKLVASGSFDTSAPPQKSRRLRTLSLTSFISKHGGREVLLWLELKEGRRSLGNDFVFFARPKHLELPEPGISLAIDPQAGKAKEFVLRLDSLRPALWTWLEVDGIEAKLSDNFFHLFPHNPHIITLLTQKPISPQELRKRIYLRTLRDTYL